MHFFLQITSHFFRTQLRKYRLIVGCSLAGRQPPAASNKKFGVCKPPVTSHLWDASIKGGDRKARGTPPPVLETSIVPSEASFLCCFVLVYKFVSRSLQGKTSQRDTARQGRHHIVLQPSREAGFGLPHQSPSRVHVRPPPPNPGQAAHLRIVVGNPPLWQQLLRHAVACREGTRAARASSGLHFVPPHPAHLGGGVSFGFLLSVALPTVLGASSEKGPALKAPVRRMFGLTLGG